MKIVLGMKTPWTTIPVLIFETHGKFYWENKNISKKFVFSQLFSFFSETARGMKLILLSKHSTHGNPTGVCPQYHPHHPISFSFFLEICYNSITQYFEF